MRMSPLRLFPTSSERLRLLLCAVMALSWLLTVKGQRFMPVLTNYGPTQYDGGLQNWSITQDNRGMMHVGNNRGMLSFDGYTWTQTPLPNKTIVRSVMADGDRIYAGSYEEFGFFQRDEFGTFKYTSLWKQLKNYKPHNDEIWKIIKMRNGNIIFQSFCSWFEYDGKKVTAHYHSEVLPLYFFNCRSSIYAQQMGHGVYKLAGDKLLPLTSRQAVGDDDVVAMLDSRRRCGGINGRQPPFLVVNDKRIRALLHHRKVWQKDLQENPRRAGSLLRSRLQRQSQHGEGVWSICLFLHERGRGKDGHKQGFRKEQVVARQGVVRQHGETVVDISKDEPTVDGDLTVRFSFANYNDMALRFTFTLKGGGLLAISHSDKPIVHYGNLPYGNFQLKCEARDALGNLVDSKAIGENQTHTICEHFILRYPRFSGLLS